MAPHPLFVHFVRASLERSRAADAGVSARMTDANNGDTTVR